MAELVSIGTIAAELGLSPSYIRLLTDHGLFDAHRTAGGHRRYDLAATRQAWLAHCLERGGRPSGGAGEGVGRPAPTVERTFPLAGLEEDRVHRELSGPLDLAGREPARLIVAYAFTEMLNNAVDHSGGTAAAVRLWRRPARVEVEIADDGEGVFAHLLTGLDLPDLFAAVQELSKGKRTTAPDRHSGEGIFFTSKAVDLFTLAANINYASDLAELPGRLGEAIDLGKKTLDNCRLYLSEDHPDTLMAGANLSRDELAAGDSGTEKDPRGDRRLAEVLGRYERTLTLEHPEARAAAQRTRLTAEIEPYDL